MGQSLEDVFKRTPAAAVAVPVTPNSNPNNFTTMLLLGMLLWLGYNAYQGREHRQDKGDDDKGHVEPNPNPNPKPVKLEGARLVFVYDMQAASEGQVQITGNLAELEQRNQMKNRILFDSEMNKDQVVQTLITDVDSQFKIKPPFMALVKSGKPFKAAAFPRTVTQSEVEEFVK